MLGSLYGSRVDADEQLRRGVRVGARSTEVLKDGVLLAQGRHDELLNSCSYYASLVGAATDGLLKVA
jgi:hypothetical protein